MTTVALRTARSPAQIALVVFFLLAIAAACVRGFFFPRQPGAIAREFREPAPPPQRPRALATLETWPRDFDAWWSDAFGLRPTLIRWHNAIKLFGFGVTPTAELFVGPGQNLFTTVHKSLEVFRGTRPMSERELWLWRHVLLARKQWCEERGIAFVYAIAPNKETIYPERVDPRFDRVGPSRLEQLEAYLVEHGDDWPVDLASALRQAKADHAREGEIYYRLGTHWNERGALVAYRHLIEAVAQKLPSVVPLPEEFVRIVPSDEQGDSWAGRLYLEDVLRQEGLAYEFESRAELLPYDEEQPQHKASNQEGSGLPRAVFIHDSFGELLRPLLAQHFSRLVCLWTAAFDPALIERERPDVVIQLQVERVLAGVTPGESPLDTPARLAEEFERAATTVFDFRALPQPITRGELRGTRLDDGSTELVGTGDGQLYLPALALPPRTWAVCRFQLDSDQPCDLVLEFLTSEQRKEFEAGLERAWSKQARALRRRLEPGTNVVLFKLLVADLWGPLRVSISPPKGSLRLVSLEVRAVGQ